jgi:DNA-binding response OmpR family regulator|tara:strand:+ start:295 stop:930 length:636 start_codon:yes stop_codon:yes gene_type:complete
MKNTLLVFGTQNFNNSLNEIKEYLNFSLVFFKKNTLTETVISTVSSILVVFDCCKDQETLNLINNIQNKPILLLANQVSFSNLKINCNDKMFFPLSVDLINSKIKSLIISKKFINNSSIVIKDYIIDKNERKIKKKNLSITITEREIQLIELLYNSSNPLSKNVILKKVWKYADDADTHTIETHIYRLRKKILSKFKDENFILNFKDGYSI